MFLLSYEKPIFMLNQRNILGMFLMTGQQSVMKKEKVFLNYLTERKPALLEKISVDYAVSECS